MRLSRGHSSSRPPAETTPNSRIKYTPSTPPVGGVITVLHLGIQNKSHPTPIGEIFYISPAHPLGPSESDDHLTFDYAPQVPTDCSLQEATVSSSKLFRKHYFRKHHFPDCLEQPVISPSPYSTQAPAPALSLRYKDCTVPLVPLYSTYAPTTSHAHTSPRFHTSPSTRPPAATPAIFTPPLAIAGAPTPLLRRSFPMSLLVSSLGQPCLRLAA